MSTTARTTRLHLSVPTLPNSARASWAGMGWRTTPRRMVARCAWRYVAVPCSVCDSRRRQATSLTVRRSRSTSLTVLPLSRTRTAPGAANSSRARHTRPLPTKRRTVLAILPITVSRTTIVSIATQTSSVPAATPSGSSSMRAPQTRTLLRVQMTAPTASAIPRTTSRSLRMSPAKALTALSALRTRTALAERATRSALQIHPVLPAAMKRRTAFATRATSEAPRRAVPGALPVRIARAVQLPRL